MHLTNGTSLQGGKYRIVRFLSSGGFGNTYEGVHTMMDTRVAIKEFFPKMFCNRDENTSHVTVATQGNRELVDKLRKKFNEEAKAVFQMKHDNIVRVLDIFEENGTAYYVMEYIDGKSLNDITKERGALPEAEAVGYIRQVADALKYVHSLNRLHLDIKPGNIMVDKNGKAILIDFGASKHYDDGNGENTSTLMGVNTKGYAPIEQSTQSFTSFSPATDIYALGATLYKLLTGIVPPDANLLLAEEEALQPLPNSISDSTRNAVMAAMQLRRKDRPQSVDEFIALLADKQSISNKNTASCSASRKKNLTVDEETIIDSNKKNPAKSPKSQKSNQEIKDEAWRIIKKFPSGFQEYNEKNPGSLEDVSYCKGIIRDKNQIMSYNSIHDLNLQAEYNKSSNVQDYSSDAKKLYKKYGKYVSLENCNKILIEEKGNFKAAERRVAKWYDNKKSPYSIVTRVIAFFVLCYIGSAVGTYIHPYAGIAVAIIGLLLGGYKGLWK